ncbi:DUF1877 family protein [Kitasatospora sp. NPDC097691]|uniref:DUF1877 family protein n=1 Tax=Kitasatospora sp. NPDC097691 TaxID=3157231 RepID=UPI0033289C40
MSVDFFWRRVAERSLDELSPKALVGLIPHWFDSEFGSLSAAGEVLGVGRNGYLIHVALTGASGGAGADATAAQLPVFGGEERVETEGDPGSDSRREWRVLVLRPDEVRTASAFLAGVDVDDLVAASDAALAAEVVSLGFATPWSEKWSRALAADLRELKAFFAGAAAAGDAVITFESA